MENMDEKSIYARSYAKESVSLKQPSYKSPSKVNKNTILTYMQNPYSNAEKLQEVSIYLKHNNGIYNRLLKYYSNMPTFDHMLYPYDIDNKKKSSSSDKLLKSYNETAQFLEKMNVKYNFRWMYQKLLECGELYVYKLEDANGIVWKEMPNTICRISSYENGVSRFSINLSKLSNGDLYATMPIEIQKFLVLSSPRERLSVKRISVSLKTYLITVKNTRNTGHCGNQCICHFEFFNSLFIIFSVKLSDRKLLISIIFGFITC